MVRRGSAPLVVRSSDRLALPGAWRLGYLPAMSSDAEQPAAAARRAVTGRLVRMGDEERAFDDAFWRSIPPEQRVEMLWDMVLDALEVKGIHGEPRLQRSVGVVQRP